MKLLILMIILLLLSGCTTTGVQKISTQQNSQASAQKQIINNTYSSINSLTGLIQRI